MAENPRKRQKYKPYFERDGEFVLPKSTRRRKQGLGIGQHQHDQSDSDNMDDQTEQCTARIELDENRHEVYESSGQHEHVYAESSNGNRSSVPEQSYNTEGVLLFRNYVEEHGQDNCAGHLTDLESDQSSEHQDSSSVLSHDNQGQFSDLEDELNSPDPSCDELNSSDDEPNPSDPSDDEHNYSDSSDDDQEDGMGLFGHDRTLNENLCPGIGTTKAEALLMVMTFAMRHSLCTVGIIHLLQLINSIIGRPVLVATKHLFEKIFHNRSINVSYQFFCTNCSCFVHTYHHNDVRETIPCGNCGDPCTVGNLSGQNFFITSDLTGQVKVLLERPDISRHLDYRFDRQKINELDVEDIYDGEIYRELSRDGQPLSNRNNFSYTFNSDGLPIFSSSKFSLWPIFLMVNELPPKLRRDNLILAGIWCGKTKPTMSVFLQKFVEEAKKLATDGVDWKRNGIELNSKLFGVCCCVDAPARASLQNTVQFNGYYGCSLCYHPGKSINNVVKYPIDVTEYADRKDDEMLSDMLRAEEENRTVRGVKGPTPLVSLPHFPIVWGFSPDFMHCSLLGVTRQLAELWFGSFGQEYYIGSPAKTALIDRRLSQVHPPNVISRTPRPVRERKYWKASEWYNWLFFFCLPCLYGILPSQYLRHMCIFIQAMHILLQKGISVAEGNTADMLMTSFVGRFQILYGSASMTYNVHSLTHLAKSVQKLGPLWAHSCFPFESSNGQVKKLLTGNKGIALQAMRKFMLIKALPIFCSLYDVSERVTVQCKQLLNVATSIYDMEDEVKLLGTQRHLRLSEEERLTLTLNGYEVNQNVDSYVRLRKSGCTYQTVEFARASMRNNKYFCLQDGTVGELHRIILHERLCLMLYKKLLLSDAVEFRDPQSGASVTHIKLWTGTENLLQVSNSQNLVSNCVVLEFNRHSYVCILPNHCVL